MRIDLTGVRYGLWVAVRYVGRSNNSDSGKTLWECHCDCGAIRIVPTHHLRGGASKSCGCTKPELTRKRATTHAGSRTPEYDVWCHMNARCHNPNDKRFDRYGERGITVCDAWRGSFSAFLNDMGARPTSKHTIERKDNDAGYSPENCCWATRKAQANNRCSSRMIEYGGVSRTLSETADFAGLTIAALHARLRRGWPLDEALSVPLRIMKQPKRGPRTK